MPVLAVDVVTYVCTIILCTAEPSVASPTLPAVYAIRGESNITEMNNCRQPRNKIQTACHLKRGNNSEPGKTMHDNIII